MTGFFSRWFGRTPDEGPARDVAALAAPLAVPAVHVVKTDEPSRSHFGGWPNLPPGIEWPARAGTPLAFLARMSLADIRRAHPVDWLPDAGALLFFYDIDQQPWGFDPKDRGGWAVLLVPDLPAPVSPSAARDAGESAALTHRNVAFRRVNVLPSPARGAVAALALSSAETDRYFALAEDVFDGQPRHQVAGLPTPVQGDGMEMECQLASNGLYCGDESGFADPQAPALAPGAAAWRLLLQIDSDDDVGVMWGDAGVIYYWVEADAARAGRFDNAWLILQCY
jgi:uncharacterized protein YwqG